MNPLECKACFERYHSTMRRPRTLPCGHSYCEPCLTTLIEKQKIKCPTCRSEHNVSNITELMIVYDLIELLDVDTVKKLVSLKSTECEEHSCPSNFFCVTHNVWICRDCTVIVHPKEKCSIKTKKIYLQEKVDKERDKLLAEKDIQENFHSSLKRDFNGIKKEMEFHQEFIVKLQSISEDHVQKKARLQIQSEEIETVIKEIGVRNNELISMIPDISTLKDLKDLNELEDTLIKSEDYLNNLRHLREKQKEKYSKKSNIPFSSIKSSCAELINLSLKYDESKTIHEDITCNECNTTSIQGDRYSCFVCNVYDICGACESTGLHGHHAKMKVPKPAYWIPIDPIEIIDSSGQKDDICGPANVLDTETDGEWDSENQTTRGCWNPGDFPRYYNDWYIIFELESSYIVTNIFIENFGNKVNDIKEFKLESSTDNEKWIPVGNTFVAKVGTSEAQHFGYFHGTGKFWKFTVLKTAEGWSPWLSVMRLMGYEGDQ